MTTQNSNNFMKSIGKLMIAVIAVVVALWVTFNIIIPLIAGLVTLLLVIAVFGGIIWLVYKVMTYDPDQVR